MRKIAVVVASRANWGRLKSVCKAITDNPDLELQLIIGASALDIPIEYKPDAVVQCLVEGDNLQAMTLTTGLFLTQLGGVLERLKPDMVLVHGDRYEVLAAAITASYMNIPLAHTEGGDASGTIDGKVRHAITKLSDIHFPVTPMSHNRLVRMGVDHKDIFIVGSTALDSLIGIDLSNNRNEPYVLVLHHPNTTEPEDITPLIEAVTDIPIHKLWVNPNVDPGNKAMLKLIHKQDVEFIKNLPPEEYARILNNCKFAIGNSSSFIKEGAFLGTPAILVGRRQKSREIGNNVIYISEDYKNIRENVLLALQKNRFSPDYRFGDGTAGRQVAKILAEVNL